MRRLPPSKGFTVKASYVATIAALALLASPAIAQMSIDKSEATPGDTFKVSFSAQTSNKNPLYFAAVIDMKYVYFFDAQGNAVPYQAGKSTPYRFATSALNDNLSLLNYTVPTGVEANIDFYAVYGKTSNSGDIFSDSGANLDLGTLKQVSVKLGPKRTAQTATGKVVDTLANGATVCVDKNANRLCDSDESKATAAADGSFSLASNDIDLNRYPVIAVTSANYVLEAPVGKYAVVSPLTTLVKNELDIDKGTTVDKAALVVGIENGVNASLLLKDYSVFGNDLVLGDDAKTAAKVAALLSQVWKKVGDSTGLAKETDARRRAAITQYSRNLSYKNGWVWNEALAQAKGDPVAAVDKVAALNPSIFGDKERDNKVAMMADQRFSSDWVAKSVADTLASGLGIYSYFSYDATTNRLTLNMNQQKDGLIKKLDIVQYPIDVIAKTDFSTLQFTKVGATYVTKADGTVQVDGKNSGYSIEGLTSVDELDLTGRTIKLGELIGYSSSVLSIPAEYNTPITFSAGAKMWREHHDKTSAPLAKSSFTTRAANAQSLEAYVLSKNDEFSPYATMGDYAVYLVPADKNQPLAGTVMAYNTKTQSRFKAGTYYSRIDGDRTYAIINAYTLKGVSGATPTTAIYFDSTSKAVMYASWRDYVMYCLCWMRKLNPTAVSDILSTLKKIGSPLITPPTNASTAPATGHAPVQKKINFLAMDSLNTASPADIALIKAAVCGGCVGGDCQACPIGDVTGLR